MSVVATRLQSIPDLPNSNPDLLQDLLSESSASRCQANSKLAREYFAEGKHHKAKHLIQRAWLQSQCDTKFLEDYIRIHEATGDIDGIYEALKRTGLRRARDGKIDKTLRYLGRAVHTYHRFQTIDRIRFDHDITDALERLASPYRFRAVARRLGGRKIRLGYLLIGLLTDNSVLIKHMLSFAEHHDLQKFDVTFFAQESEAEVAENTHATRAVNHMRSLGCKVVFGPEQPYLGSKKLAVGRQIYRSKLDILVTNSGLASPWVYFITALRPAPVLIGMNHGNPYVYTSHLVDWSVSWTIHGALESLSDGSFVEGGIDLENRDGEVMFSKNDLGIPEGALVAMSSGRPEKFQHAGYWEALIRLLRQQPKLHYVVAGIHADQVAYLTEANDIKDRIHCLGWRSDVYRLLGCADIYLDTFPVGGGFSMFEAMNVGLPAVSFQNDYMKLFDPEDWSPAYEYFSIPELMARRYDFDHFASIVESLIDDHQYRKRLGEFGQEQVRLHVGCPQSMVEKCEHIYTTVLERKINAGWSRSDQTLFQHLIQRVRLWALQIRLAGGKWLRQLRRPTP